MKLPMESEWCPEVGRGPGVWGQGWSPHGTKRPGTGWIARQIFGSVGVFLDHLGWKWWNVDFEMTFLMTYGLMMTFLISMKRKSDLMQQNTQREEIWGNDPMSICLDGNYNAIIQLALGSQLVCWISTSEVMVIRSKGSLQSHSWLVWCKAGDIRGNMFRSLWLEILSVKTRNLGAKFKT